MIRYLIPFFLILCFYSCSNETNKDVQTEKEEITNIKLTVPSFNRDSAFYFVEKQLTFGPRRPNTDAHKACKEWMYEKLKSFGLGVKTQDFKATSHFGEEMQGYNVIARYNPDKSVKRILLSAHWDTRYKAEKDKDPSKVNKAIPGADDGASGVAVLMEIARVIALENNLPIGIDFVLFDLEDQGKNGTTDVESWCLGSQYWTKNPHFRDFKFGINLDMVGSKGATFKKEGFSMKYSPTITNKIWTWAQRLGYNNYFPDRRTGSITDDHYFVNISGITPMTNIIYTSDQASSTFGPHWHTHGDNLENIDRNTLKAVGQVVTNVIYKEAEGRL